MSKINLSIFGGIVLGCFIIACSVTYRDPDYSEKFRKNFAGIYDINSSAIITQKGLEMDFSKGTIKIQTLEEDDVPLLLNIFTDGAVVDNTIDSIYFEEGDKNGTLEQKLEIYSPTNAILQNVAINPVTGSSIFNEKAEINIDLETEKLYYNDIEIGTKSSSNTPAPGPIPDPDMEKNFKSNMHGSYTVSPTAVLTLCGLVMDFSTATIRITASSYEGYPVYLDISINGAQAANTLFRIAFNEGDDNSGYPQSINITSSTEATLNNVRLTPTSGNGPTIYNTIGQIRAESGKLYYNNVEIGTKNP